MMMPEHKKIIIDANISRRFVDELLKHELHVTYINDGNPHRRDSTIKKMGYELGNEEDPAIIITKNDRHFKDYPCVIKMDHLESEEYVCNALKLLGCL